MSAETTPRRGLAETRKTLLALRERQRTAARSTTDVITPADRDRALPLSFTQQRLWFLDRWAPGQPVYNSPIALLLRADLDHAALQRALTALVARHEILRTVYPEENGVPFQRVQPPAPVPLPVIDLTDAPTERVDALVEQLAREPFDLSTGPVLRATLIRRAPREHVLVLAMHHIVTDGWSTEIVTRELVAFYQSERAGRDAGLGELAVQYADYAVWQRGWLTGEVLDGQLSYWRDRLADLPSLDMPTDRPRPAVPTQRGTTRETLLAPELRDALNRLARSERVTLLTTVLAAYTALMSRYTGQDDIVLGSVFSGRTRPGTEELIGFFANTLVLRTSTAGDPTFRQLLARTHETVMGAHFHQDLPFGRLVEELRPERDPSRNPLFQASFTLQHATVEAARVGDIEVEGYPLDLGTARFDLAVQLTEIPQGLRLWAEFSTELFDPDRIERLFTHYDRILQAVTANPDLRLSELPLLTDQERDRLTAEWNDTGRRLPTDDRCLHQLFEAAADARPEAPALRFEQDGATYRELDRRANQLAWALRAAGVGPEIVTGVLLERGPAIPAALLGVTKAGGAYLPLDPDHPPTRWETLLAEARSTVVVTTSARARALPAGVTAVCVDDPALAEHPEHRPPLTVRPDNLAYVIFTSGSTGRPKGVQVSHRSIVNFTTAVTELFRIGDGDRVLQFANPAFDVSLFDFLSALCSGAELVQAPREVLLDPQRLTALMRDAGVTVADLPPAVLGLLDPAELPALRTLFVGLEAFPGELVNRWVSDTREFHNGYGPTEATVACIDHRCPNEPHDSMPPIGMPLANYRAYVVDRYGNPVPMGVPGELLIGGVGVARGYAHRPAQTAERFVPDEFGPPGGRLYRTGDLVRMRVDGNLEFLGRVDDQIKIRGLRVEPGEIEAALTAHERVAAAAVVAHGSGVEARLVGYLTTVDDGELDLDDLRRFLGDRLPGYLVPGTLMVLPELPRGASGKLDRKRLPAPDAGSAPVAAVAPSTPTERMLADIWRDVLAIKGTELSVRDNFFAVGGNSLKITQLASRIRDAFGVSLDLRDLFTRCTIAELADLVEQGELAAVADDELAALLAEIQPGHEEAS
ncbi:amino acid adenylation domain-containing protein [Actinoplanes sp. NEAU-A12]|uniref:Amino acid adenylation domain-containing protein n=1 Tax=Actinoplanes sandaracinus TaxID=3045177 RepID=A0ABT6WTB7_9ACTN|nr:amino acid adenylation domain-containing protein [Actinoplanes sandaracinus]MDI6103000.1 amino acid adenylation domain-containing protein [Actinoplanes sandaracinus]